MPSSRPGRLRGLLEWLTLYRDLFGHPPSFGGIARCFCCPSPEGAREQLLALARRGDIALDDSFQVLAVHARDWPMNAHEWERAKGLLDGLVDELEQAGRGEHAEALRLAVKLGGEVARSREVNARLREWLDEADRRADAASAAASIKKAPGGADESR
jgi:LexA DNA binding domain